MLFEKVPGLNEVVVCSTHFKPHIQNLENQRYYREQNEISGKRSYSNNPSQKLARKVIHQNLFSPPPQTPLKKKKGKINATTHSS